MSTHRNLLASIARAEGVIAGLRALAALPESAHWDFSGHHLPGDLLQFFPHGHKLPEGHREKARSFCRLLGGRWAVRSDGSWECACVQFPGLEGCAVTLHYVEPQSVPVAAFVDMEAAP